jgi:SAM-dependent methyltransferase
VAQDHVQYENNLNSFFEKLPADAFENVGCIFCNNKTSKINLFKKNTLTVDRCKCGFVYNSHQAKQDALDIFYSKSNAMNDWVEIKNTERENKRQKEKFGKAVEYLETIKVKSVIDIGCGTGSFLSMFSGDIEKVGVDQNEASLDVAANNGVRALNLSIEQTIEKFQKEEKQFDVASFWGVLEHVKDPFKVLRSVKDIVGRERYVVACVPNVDSLVVQSLWSDCFTFQPTHLWYYNLKTLKNLFWACGIMPKLWWTIEPEYLPVKRKWYGIDPYANLPEWEYEKQLIESHEFRTAERNILTENRGYKIVMIGEIVE